jgi:PAS domain S-box-containing protein
VTQPRQKVAPAPPPETLDELYEHAPCGYLTTRADGVIVRVNATLLSLLAETRDTLLGRRIQTILAPGARIFYEIHCAPLLTENGFLNEVSIDLARADGGQLPALVNWRRVEDAKGTIVGFRVIVVSATERVAYERELLAERDHARHQEAKVRELDADLELRVAERAAELVQSQKMASLAQLTGGVAHDFNNLLTPILITLDLLHSRYIKDERALRMAASAISAAERARVLIARLVAFAGRQHLQPKAVDLGRWTDGMFGLVTQSLGPQITVNVAIAARLPPARVDQNQLEMALLNLCVNARDAMPYGGAVTIGGDTVTIKSDGELPAGRYVRLSVSDTGTGMNTETLRRAAEPFYTTKSAGKGTGLGLSMVHGLAAQSGGMLALESTPGHGTTATIWLPVDDTAASHSALGPETVVPAPLVAPQRALSILLVDDDALGRFATGEMLADLGHATIRVASGAQALEALRQHAKFDLLITDYLMPGMTGVELARIARMSHPGLPVLLFTGYANIKDVNGGGLPRLAKPFDTHDLSDMITETLAAAGDAHTPRRSLV